MLPIQRMITKYNFKRGRNSKIKWIVIHYTGNKGDTAKNNAIYFNKDLESIKKPVASAHYFTSDKEIYQVVEDNDTAYSVRDGGNGAYNDNTLNVEMCCFTDGQVSNTTEANTVELVKDLMNKHSVDIDHVVRHQDVTGKICPNWSLERWNNFKGKLIDKVIQKEESKLRKVFENSSVKYGEKSDRVTWVQTALKLRGEYSGPIDGQYGPSKESNSLYVAVGKINNKAGFKDDFRFGPGCYDYVTQK